MGINGAIGHAPLAATDRSARHQQRVQLAHEAGEFRLPLVRVEQGRGQGGIGKQHPLLGHGPLCGASALLAMALSQIEQDRATFKQAQLAAGEGRIRVDQGGHLAEGIDG